MKGYSIVMPYYHRPDHLYNTLMSFAYWYADRADNYEVVLVEDIRSHENAEYAEELRAVVGAFPGVPVRIVVAEKEGLSSMHNLGVRHAVHPYILLNGAEVLHARHCLRLYDRHFEEHPESYAVGSCQCSEFPGRLQEFDPFRMDELGLRFMEWYQHGGVRRKDRCLHFSAAMHRDTFESVGGFCTDFDAGAAYEDDDFIENVRYCGVPVYNLDKAITVHQAHPAVVKEGMDARFTHNHDALVRRRNARAAGTARRRHYGLPVIINNRNLLTWPRAMVDDLRRFGLTRIVILDNDSSYAPLCEWYASGEVEVVYNGVNGRHRAPWDSGLVHRLLQETGAANYIVTDPDLDLSEVPDDCVEKFLECYNVYGSDIHKIGLSLYCDDLPDNEVTSSIRNWEKQYWEQSKASTEYAGKKLPHRIFMAAIDTTFAMYRVGSTSVPRATGQARLDIPYTARHLPWYLTADNVTDEYRYYMNNADACSSWGTLLKNILE